MAHGDYTGQTKTRLAQAHAEEQQFAATKMSLVSQVVEEGRNNEIDLWTELDDRDLARWRKEHAEEGTVLVDDTPENMKKVRFRASEDLDQVTVGQGREFNLKAGYTYLAPLWVVQHLDGQGLVWH